MRGERDEVLVLRADFNDGAQVRAAVDAAIQHFGRIDLAVHGAARIDAAAFASAAETGPSVVEAQFSPKLRGMYHLIDALRGREPRRWILQSSISSSGCPDCWPSGASSWIVQPLRTQSLDCASRTPVPNVGVWRRKLLPAIVICRGNLTLLPGNGSMFSGLLYVDGNFTMRSPSEIRGAVVGTGNVTIQGASDYATIYYDDDVLDALRARIGTYRQVTAPTRPVMTER